MEKPLIWIVDCDQWPRAALRAELIERGYDAIGYFLLEEALALLRGSPSQAKPRAIVLELRGQEISREALQELAQSSVPAIMLGGTVELNDPLIQMHKWAAVRGRPITLGEVADLIQNLAPNK